MSTPAEFFDGSPIGLAVYSAVAEVVAGIGPANVRITKSQIAFRRRRIFALVWRPGQYVRSDVPAVLSFGLGHELHSPRMKEVVHPTPSIWMHHVELRDPAEVDDEVRGWLEAAYADAH